MSNETDILVRYARQGLWTALLLMLALAGWAVAVNLFPGTRFSTLASKAALMLPLCIVFAVASMQRVRRDSAAMQAVLHDELRQQSMQRACRNGLLAVLLAQPLLAVLCALAPLPQPVPLMAALTVLTGVATVLVSMLAYDR